MISLIDADIVAFRCAASAEHDPQDIAEVRVNELMQRILHETNAIDYKGFLTGSNNFRYEIYPEYKANRKDKPRPRHLDACKELLIKEWNCKVTDGIEADDQLGIEQDKSGDSTIICSIDKDLLQIPGRHFNFVRQEERFIGDIDGWRNFYSQLITGDASDNIPAFDGKFRHSIPKFVQKLLDPLQEMVKEIDMYNYCKDIYSNQVSWADDWESVLHRNAHLLYIQKHEGDKWSPPTTMADGQQEDLEVLSEELYEMLHSVGLPNTNV